MYVVETANSCHVAYFHAKKLKSGNKIKFTSYLEHISDVGHGALDGGAAMHINKFLLIRSFANGVRRTNFEMCHIARRKCNFGSRPR